MTLSTTDKAGVLIQALPYIQKYTDKIVVIKYGGNAMIDDALKQAVMSDLVLLSLVGIKVVLVHGGGPEISQTLQRMGKESKFIGGLRVTDAETAEIVQMVLCGKVNKDLVSLIQQNNGRALGLCGIDGQHAPGTKAGWRGRLGLCRRYHQRGYHPHPQRLAQRLYPRHRNGGRR